MSRKSRGRVADLTTTIFEEQATRPVVEILLVQLPPKPIKDLNDKLKIVPTTGTILQTLQVPHAAAIKATAMPAKMQKTPASLTNTNTEGLNTNTQNKRRRQKKNDISQHKPAESVETESPSQRQVR